MLENRSPLNAILGSLANVDVKLGNITQALEKEGFHVGQFVQLYLQFDSIVQAIRRTVWQPNSYVKHVQLQLHMLSLEHLSQSVITPRSLKGLLLEINNYLPEYLKLLYDLKGENCKLYQTLTCTTVLYKVIFLVIFSTPLLDNMNSFEIFNIFHVPVPVKEGTCCAYR